jgi:hypothetical protein
MQSFRSVNHKLKLLLLKKMIKPSQIEVKERSVIKTHSLTLMINLQMTVVALRWARSSSPLFQVELQAQDLARKLLNIRETPS